MLTHGVMATTPALDLCTPAANFPERVKAQSCTAIVPEVAIDGASVHVEGNGLGMDEYCGRSPTKQILSKQTTWQGRCVVFSWWDAYCWSTDVK